MDYYPFGGIRIDSGSFNEQRKFTGYEYDGDTGLNYAGSRYYDASTGRFVSQDPAYLLTGDQSFRDKYKRSLGVYLSDPQGIGSYSYVNNNPLKYTDPDGEILPLIGIGLAEAAEIATVAVLSYAPQITSYLQSLTTPVGQYGLTQAAQDAKQGNYGIAAIGAVTSGEFPEGRAMSLFGKVGDAGRVITKMNPNEIRFTQDSISSVFRNGNSLESTINGLKSGKISPNDFPPIRVFERDGEMYSLDNRRLEVFQRAGMDIPTVRATPQEIKNEIVRKFTTPNEGKSIIVR